MVFLLLCFVRVGLGLLILYGIYCLCRTKRVCSCCKRRVKPYNNQCDYYNMNRGLIYESQVRQTQALEKKFDEAEQEYWREREKNMKDKKREK